MGERLFNTFKLAYGLLLWGMINFAQAENLSISVAASLAPSFERISQKFRTLNPQDTLQVNYGASSVLARQIQYGAPADLFISANKKWIEYLDAANKLSDDGFNHLVSNQLVLVKSRDTGANHLSQSCYDQSTTQNYLSFLAGIDDLVVVAEMSHVPLGIYTKQTLIKSGFYDKMLTKLIPSANARSTLAFIEQKQVDYGFLYYSDAINSKSIDIICIIPSDFHDPINYYFAKVQNTQNISQSKTELIARFSRYLTSDEVKAIFVSHGFLEN